MQKNTCFVSGLLLAVLALFSQCNNPTRGITLSTAIPAVDSSRTAKMLTAFFGLDNALPEQARAIYFDAPGQDGMPLVFSLEVDPATLDASDFEVTTQDGRTFEVAAATLRPASEAFELRTVLLIGEYGNHPDNPPTAVRVVGDLKSRTGVNLKGARAPVIPLEAGPILSYAEYFAWTETERKAGCDCPNGTKMVVKAVWAGGVRALDGSELGDAERGKFAITLVAGSDTAVVTPFQLADLADNDNNTDLCLDVEGVPIQVSVQANTAIDPRDDPNPKTSVAVVSRW